MIQKNLKFVFSSLKFRYFEQTIKDSTWFYHDEIINWAKNRITQPIVSNSEIVTIGLSLRKNILENYQNFYKEKKITLFLHVPEKKVSPAGYSIFNGYFLALKFMGVDVHCFSTKFDFDNLSIKFIPNVIMASDNDSCFSSINWDFISKIKNNSKLIVGLTASTEAVKNDEGLELRLKRALSKKIDFFYSFKSKAHINNNSSFIQYFNSGFKIFDIEFGCNPIYHFPVDGGIKDLDYIFLASSNIDKRDKYYKWLPKITNNYHGFIDGPGWHKINNFAEFEIHNLLYSRSKVGLNLHIKDSISFESELNERTYILAACGIPQLIDNPKLLFQRFSKESLFSAENPREYFDMFQFMLENPLECNKRAIFALEEVFERHNIFLRLNKFLFELNVEFELYER